MAVSLFTFKSLVTNAATAVQGACAQTLDLTVGSVIRAILESNSAVGLWLQYLFIQVLSITRLSTSTGSYADSWVGDFGLTRLPGAPATGTVIFTSFTPGDSSAVVLVGSIVRTTTSISYAVYADTTNTAFDPVQNGYVRTLGTATVSAPVQAVVQGTSGNVSAGVVNLLGTAVAGIDTVSNPVAFVNGTNGETDAALKVRFVSYLNSLNEGTSGAITNAISSVQAGLLYQLEENTDVNGNFEPGNFCVFVDDGSGDPSAALISQVYAAVDKVRPFTVSFSVLAPNVLRASVSMTVAVASNGNVPSIMSDMSNAITAYFASLQVGAGASYSRIIQIAYATDPVNINNISNVLLNGQPSDLTAVFGQAVRAGTITITPSN